MGFLPVYFLGEGDLYDDAGLLDVPVSCYSMLHDVAYMLSFVCNTAYGTCLLPCHWTSSQ